MADTPMHKNANTTIFLNAQDLRKALTGAEEIMWNTLKNRKLGKLKFRRQHPIGSYIADFYCHELRLAIEIDGSIHKIEENKEYDEARTEELKKLGITVLRFTNDDVKSKLRSVKQAILAFSKPRPSPSGEGRG
jgi:very-short-patch-repair endonuclease